MSQHTTQQPVSECAASVSKSFFADSCQTTFLKFANFVLPECFLSSLTYDRWCIGCEKKTEVTYDREPAYNTTAGYAFAIPNTCREVGKASNNGIPLLSPKRRQFRFIRIKDERENLSVWWDFALWRNYSNGHGGIKAGYNQLHTCRFQNSLAVHGSSIKRTKDSPSNLERRWASKLKYGPTAGSFKSVQAQSQSERWYIVYWYGSGSSGYWTFTIVFSN